MRTREIKKTVPVSPRGAYQDQARALEMLRQQQQQEDQNLNMLRQRQRQAELENQSKRPSVLSLFSSLCLTRPY
jgi:hypothetical protein